MVQGWGGGGGGYGLPGDVPGYSVCASGVFQGVWASSGFCRHTSKCVMNKSLPTARITYSRLKSCN